MTDETEIKISFVVTVKCRDDEYRHKKIIAALRKHCNWLHWINHPGSFNGDHGESGSVEHSTGRVEWAMIP